MRFVLAFLLLVWLGPAAGLAQDSASAPLQGRWVVVGAEHGGKPMDSIKGGVMTIAGGVFEIRTASGNMLKGTLRLDASAAPFKMDMLHADGTVWEAIYQTAADTLRLNYVERGGKDPRPTTFTTSERTEESIVTLRRESLQK
jgi:uncharacterized protein (TIGR03067 family)